MTSVFNEFVLAAKCATVGFVYCELLIQPGFLLYPFFQWLEKKLSFHVEQLLPDNAPEEVKAMPYYHYKPLKKITLKKHWLLKVLGDCPYCTTGQLTLWSYLFVFFVAPLIGRPALIIEAIGNWIFSICLAILFIMILKKLYERWSIQ